MTKRKNLPCVSLLLEFFLLLLLSGCSGGGGGGGSPSNPAPVVTQSPLTSASPTTFIEGYVYSSKAKQTGPLAGATVRLRGLDLTTTTDENGFFRIEGVTPGRYDVYVLKSGYGLIPRQCTVVSGSNKLENLNATENNTPQIAYFEPDPPDEGGPIRIYGVNFGNNPQVKFNSLPVDTQDFWSRQDDEMICMVPSGATSGNVSVIVGANTASKSISVATRKDLVISSHYVSATASDVPVTVRLNKSLNDLNGFAFFLKYDSPKITVNTSYGKNGVEKASSLNSGLLVAQSRASTASDVEYLDVGFTLKGDTLSGQRDLVVVHFRPNGSLRPGMLCKIEMDTSRKQPKACIKTGGSASYQNLTWTAGYLVVRR